MRFVSRFACICPTGRVLLLVFALLSLGCDDAKEQTRFSVQAKLLEAQVDRSDSANVDSLEPPRNIDAAVETTDRKPLTAEQFLEAAFTGEMELLERFVSSSPTQLDVQDPDQRTALMLASFNGHTDAVRMLLERKADVNLIDGAGRTALMYAASGSNLEVVKSLVEHKADINAVDSIEHWSPLMFAASEGQVKIVQYLLEQGADKTAKDVDGEDSIDFARSKAHADVVWLLENF